MKCINLFILLFLIASCSNDQFVETKNSRGLSSYETQESTVDKDSLWYKDLVAKQNVKGGTIEFPPGIKGKEIADLWHLTEGSDFFPLKWMYNLESQTTDIDGTMFLERLDEKFGVIKDNYSSNYGYPLKWVGLSSSWTESDPRSADVLIENGSSDVKFIKWEGQKPKIAMSGVNCAFCHTSEVSFQVKGERTVHKKILEGAPAMLYMRGFFQDMMLSTVKTMLDVEKLTAFLDNNRGYSKGTSKSVAESFVNDFKGELGLNVKGLKKLMGNLYKRVSPEGYQEKLTDTVKRALFEKRDKTLDYMLRLVELTYDLKGNSAPVELRYRLERVAILVGADPDLPTTPEGYSRTDAFGRIGNLVARINNPTELTATTSVPHMWGMKYKSMFHWNANTNSVMNRNIGQSFGLGAVLTNPDGEGDARFDSTSNLHNLARLERLLYKLEVPNFRKSFPNHNLEAKKSLENGCRTFANKCMGCHQSNVRVGPQDKLIHDHIIKHDVINTDAWYTELQKAPVDGVAFKKALFDFVNSVKGRYYSKYEVTDEEINDWQSKDLRGPEYFRDTFLGESDHENKATSYLNISKENAGYPSRSLAGVWATAPYLHNGSIANVRQLLTPENKREKIFFVGSNKLDITNMGFESTLESLPGGRENVEAEFRKTLSEKSIISKANNGTYEMDLVAFACDTFPTRCLDTTNKGNSNIGHSGEKFGTNMSQSDKDDLIKFIKYVKPHIEYSWKEKPLYRIVRKGKKKSCELY